MGKKKSKISKSKQAKASKQAPHKKRNNIPSSLGGISMSKGLSSKFQQNQQVMGSNKQAVLVLESNNKRMFATPTSTSTSISGTSPFSKKFNKPHAKKVFLSPPPVTSTATQKKSAKNQYDEQAEFHRQMASLQERQAASRHANSRQQKKKSTLLQQGGAVSSMVSSFQPASFAVEKTTTDLLQEAVGQMQNMEGVGQTRPAAVDTSPPTPIINNQSWASLVPATKTNTNNSSNNPFAALQEDDEDSDNDYAPNKNHNSNSLFPMAPATFTLLPRTTPTPATTPLRESQFSRPNGQEDDAIDPDL
jgi:hypothetical protein